MRSVESYIEDPNCFQNKLKSLGTVPDNAILVTAEVVDFYPSISYKDGLNALSAKLEEQLVSNVNKDDLFKMAVFAPKYNFLEFNSKVMQQVISPSVCSYFYGQGGNSL